MSGAPGSSRRTVAFGPFEANLAARELRKNGVRLKLQDQPFRVLQALLEKPGQVVTREELQERIWGEDTYVDFDKSLSAAVGKVRDALGDSRTRPQFVETIPKVGYRFIAALDVERADDPTQRREGDESAEPAPRRRWILGAAAAACLAVGAWLYSSQPEAPAASLKLKPVPLTSLDGREDLPTFSPDGSQVAFAAMAGGDFAIYVKAIGSEETRKVTSHEGSAAHPAWAPDGSAIAYLLRTEAACELRLIPPLGGASELVTPVTCSGSDNFFYTHLAWSRDSRHIVYRDKPLADEPWALFAIERTSKTVTQLTRPPAGIWSDDAPSLAWGTNRMAFIRRYSAFNASEIHTIDLSPDMEPVGKPEAVSIDRSRPLRSATSVVWDRGDRDLLFLDAEGLWRAPREGGRAVSLLAAEGTLKGLTLSRDGRRLAFSQGRGDIDILRFDRGDGSMKPMLTSTHFDWYQSISPDGKRIAWTSRRSGFSEIWVCNADGSHVQQLTHLESHSGTPVWSPDGTTLAFDTRVDGNGDIYLVDAGGGPPRPLTKHPADDLMPGWSADDTTVYFESLRDGGPAIWSIDVDSGQERRVSDSRGHWPIAGPDGRFLYFRGDLTDERGRIYRRRLEDGEESLVLDGVASFAPTSGGLYFSPSGSGEIRRLDIESGKTEDILEARPPITNIAVSPDEQTILFTQREPDRTDIMLVEPFHIRDF